MRRRPEVRADLSVNVPAIRGADGRRRFCAVVSLSRRRRRRRRRRADGSPARSPPRDFESRSRPRRRPRRSCNPGVGSPRAGGKAENRTERPACTPLRRPLSPSRLGTTRDLANFVSSRRSMSRHPSGEPRAGTLSPFATRIGDQRRGGAAKGREGTKAFLYSYRPLVSQNRGFGLPECTYDGCLHVTWVSFYENSSQNYNAARRGDSRRFLLSPSPSVSTPPPLPSSLAPSPPYLRSPSPSCAFRS